MAFTVEDVMRELSQDEIEAKAFMRFAMCFHALSCETVAEAKEVIDKGMYDLSEDMDHASNEEEANSMFFRVYLPVLLPSKRN